MLKLLFVLLNSAKLLPLLKSGGTMLLSVGVYALIYGWWYAVGFVLLIFVHEMGHYLSARRAGLAVGLPAFIPFIGAWIELKEQPLSVEQEARIAFAGPFLGTAGTLVVLAAAIHFASPLLMALAYAGFFINLFNLIPVTPFDGGRVVAILSPKVWLFGVPVLLGVFLLIPSPMFLVILLLLAPGIWRAVRGAWKGETPEDKPRYYEVPLEARIRYGCYYVLLLAFLCVMTWMTHAQVAAMRSGAALAG